MTWNSPLSGLTPHAPISSPAPDEVGRIKSAVARMYGIERRWMQHQSNRKGHLLPRQVAMYLCCELTDVTLVVLAREFGIGHHTTVIHAERKVARMLAEDPQFQARVAALRAELERLGVNG